MHSLLKIKITSSSITPHMPDVTGVIVLTLCVCVRLSVSLSQPNGQTNGLEFWHGGQVKGYLGQVIRSRSQVKGQGHWVKRCSFGCFIDFSETLDLPKKKLRNMTVRNTTWGVFKAYSVSFLLKSPRSDFNFTSVPLSLYYFSTNYLSRSWQIMYLVASIRPLPLSRVNRLTYDLCVCNQWGCMDNCADAVHRLLIFNGSVKDCPTADFQLQ